MVMDETYTYGKLKEKLILLDKNTKSWSGENFLKSLQKTHNSATSSCRSCSYGKWIKCPMVRAKARTRVAKVAKARKVVGLAIWRQVLWQEQVQGTAQGQEKQRQKQGKTVLQGQRIWQW